MLLNDSPEDNEGLRDLSHPDAWEDFVIYNAWVACVVPRRQLFVYNLFSDSTDASHNSNMVRRLRIFLEDMDMQLTTKVATINIVNKCRSSKKSALTRHGADVPVPAKVRPAGLVNACPDGRRDDHVWCSEFWEVAETGCPSSFMLGRMNIGELLHQKCPVLCGCQQI
jgi:hypothetical protein